MRISILLLLDRAMTDQKKKVVSSEKLVKTIVFWRRVEELDGID